MNDLLELINSVKIASGYGEIELWGDKKSFDELLSSGFPIEDFKCREFEFEFDESKIMVIPREPKPIKLYFEGNGY